MLRTFFVFVVVSFAAASLVPASASAQGSACGVYCEQIPSGGGNGGGGNGTDPGGNGTDPGGNGTNPGGNGTSGSNSQDTQVTGGAGGGDGSAIPSEAATGTNSTVGGSAARGASEQGTAGGAKDGTPAKGEKPQVGDDSGRKVQKEVEDVATVGGISGGDDGGSGIGIGLPILLTVLLAGALGLGLARRTGSLTSD